MAQRFSFRVPTSVHELAQTVVPTLTLGMLVVVCVETAKLAFTPITS